MCGFFSAFIDRFPESNIIKKFLGEIRFRELIEILISSATIKLGFNNPLKSPET